LFARCEYHDPHEHIVADFIERSFKNGSNWITWLSQAVWEPLLRRRAMLTETGDICSFRNKRRR
jgi:hypothetical protein